MDNEEDNQKYKVLVNHEEQYSIWLDFLPIPAGWRAVGPVGGKQEVLDYVKLVWTDMRPLSLRKKMDAVPLAPE